MRRSAILTAAVGGLLVASAASAAINLSFTRTTGITDPTYGALDLININATGTGTSNYIIGVNFDATVVAPAGSGTTPYAFWVSDFGDVNVPNTGGVANKSNIRFRPPGTARNNVAAQRPAVFPNDGRATTFGFEVSAIADAGGGFASFTSIQPGPVNFMQLYVTKDAGVNFSRLQVGDQTSAKFTLNDPNPANITPGYSPFNIPAVSTSTPTPQFGAGTLQSSSDARQSLATSGDNPTIYTLTINFGNLAEPIGNFSVKTNLSDSGTIASVGTLPSGITASASGDVISGTVSGALRGSFDIPLTGSGTTGDTAILRIVAIPEPATLSVLAGVGLLALRRRK